MSVECTCSSKSVPFIGAPECLPETMLPGSCTSDMCHCLLQLECLEAFLLANLRDQQAEHSFLVHWVLTIRHFHHRGGELEKIHTLS